MMQFELKIMPLVTQNHQPLIYVTTRLRNDIVRKLAKIQWEMGIADNLVKCYGVLPLRDIPWSNLGALDTKTLTPPMTKTNYLCCFFTGHCFDRLQNGGTIPHATKKRGVHVIHARSPQNILRQCATRDSPTVTAARWCMDTQSHVQ